MMISKSYCSTHKSTGSFPFRFAFRLVLVGFSLLWVKISCLREGPKSGKRTYGRTRLATFNGLRPNSVPHLGPSAAYQIASWPLSHLNLVGTNLPSASSHSTFQILSLSWVAPTNSKSTSEMSRCHGTWMPHTSPCAWRKPKAHPEHNMLRSAAPILTRANTTTTIKRR